MAVLASVCHSLVPCGWAFGRFSEVVFLPSAFPVSFFPFLSQNMLHRTAHVVSSLLSMNYSQEWNYLVKDLKNVVLYIFTLIKNNAL